MLCASVAIALLSLCALSPAGCLVFKLDSMREPFTIEKTVIDSQICKGVFGIARPSSAVLEIMIYGEDGRRVFYKDSIVHGDTVNLSFNTSYGQVYTIKVNAKKKPPKGEPLYLKYEFTSQFNTFDKNVAKAKVIAPAMEEMARFEKLLYESGTQTGKRQQEASTLTESFRQIVMTIFVINFVIFGCFSGITAFHILAFQSFLKKKKLI